MRVGVLIQTRELMQLGTDCRMATLGRRSVLAQVIQRVQTTASIDGCAIITGTDQRDNAVADLAKFQGLACFRSPSDRPGQALSLALGKLQWDAFVSVRSDSPLISSELIERAMQEFTSGSYELVTLGSDRGFPLGQEVEVVQSRLLLTRAPFVRLPDSRQPLAQWFQKLVPKNLFLRVRCEQDWSDVSMAIESIDDLERMRWFLQAAGTSIWNASWTAVALEMRRLGCSRLDADEAAA